jgi:hypothetical protein
MVCELELAIRFLVILSPESATASLGGHCAAEYDLRQCTAHQMRLNSMSTEKSFIRNLLPREVIGLKSKAVSIKEPLR